MGEALRKALRASLAAQHVLSLTEVCRASRRSTSAPLVMDEAELPEVLREALKAARERMADKRARRARGEAGDDEDEDDDEEFEARLLPQVNTAAAPALPLLPVLPVAASPCSSCPTP